MNAGVDMDMVGEFFVNNGVNLVKSGRVAESQIDAACRRILEAKYKLGLFEDPFRFVNEDRNKEQMMSPDKLALSKEATTKSMVLLKNANGTLPLDAKTKVAFIGPLVKDKRYLIGAWGAAGDWHKAISVAEALDTRFGAGKYAYAKGCNIIDDAALIEKLNRDGGALELDERKPEQMIDQAVQTAQEADVVVAVLGEPNGFSGEAASRSSIGLPENQVELLKALKKTGKPIVLVL